MLKSWRMGSEIRHPVGEPKESCLGVPRRDGDGRRPEFPRYAAARGAQGCSAGPRPSLSTVWNTSPNPWSAGNFWNPGIERNLWDRNLSAIIAGG